MFRWFKKKVRPDDESVVAMADLARNWAGPTILVTAVGRTVEKYFADVARGIATFPAYQRKGESVVGIWRDTRLEALRQLWGAEGWRSEPKLLADRPKQSEMIALLLDERPHLETPQPRGEPKADTIQALFQVYAYLGEVGSNVGDKQTDRLTLKLKGRTVFDDLTDRAAQLRGEWARYREILHTERGDPLAFPKTLFEALYEDVAAKTKSIALTAIWGTNPEADMTSDLEEIRRRMEARGEPEREIADAIAAARATCNRVLAARDPDEFSGR